MDTQTAGRESTTRLVRALNQLIHLDFDAIRAYESAVDRLSNETAKQTLTGFKHDHEQHVVKLQRLVRELGGTPAESADVKRLLTQGKVILQSLRGDAGILQAMKSNEDQTNAGYEEALLRSDLPPACRRVLQENLADERRHRAWLVAQLDQLDPVEEIGPPTS